MAYIDDAINETDPQHFLQEIKRLYPNLTKCGMIMPMIQPVKIGEKHYDSTWYGFHHTFLKCLRRFVRNNEFKLDQWNSDVERENAKRQTVVLSRQSQ